jgi:hypothetical protein
MPQKMARKKSPFARGKKAAGLLARMTGRKARFRKGEIGERLVWSGKRSVRSE